LLHHLRTGRDRARATLAEADAVRDELAASKAMGRHASTSAGHPGV